MTTARNDPANNFPNPDIEKKAATVAITIADNNTTYLNILNSKINMGVEKNPTPIDCFPHNPLRPPPNKMCS